MLVTKRVSADRGVEGRGSSATWVISSFFSSCAVFASRAACSVPSFPGGGGSPAECSERRRGGVNYFSVMSRSPHPDRLHSLPSLSRSHPPPPGEGATE